MMVDILNSCICFHNNVASIGGNCQKYISICICIKKMVIYAIEQTLKEFEMLS
ncbi:hypothetical protein YC2023_106457 [Brassica napus]